MPRIIHQNLLDQRIHDLLVKFLRSGEPFHCLQSLFRPARFPAPEVPPPAQQSGCPAVLLPLQTPHAFSRLGCGMLAIEVPIIYPSDNLALQRHFPSAATAPDFTPQRVILPLKQHPDVWGDLLHPHHSETVFPST